LENLSRAQALGIPIKYEAELSKSAGPISSGKIWRRNLWRGWEAPRRKDAKTQGRKGVEKGRKEGRKEGKTKNAYAAGGGVPPRAIAASAACLVSQIAAAIIACRGTRPPAAKAIFVLIFTFFFASWRFFEISQSASTGHLFQLFHGPN
jgi:hypothetical protein